VSRRWRLRLLIYGGIAVALAVGFGLAFKYADPPTGEPDVVYATTPQPAVERMLELAEVTKDDVVYDLGCGDGRFPITAAKKYGCRGVGVEMQKHLVGQARENALSAGVGHLVEIRQGDLFDTDLRECTVLTIYLLPDLNARLIPKIEKMRPGSRVVSFLFDMNKEDAVSVKEKVELVRMSNGRDPVVYLWRTPLRFEPRPPPEPQQGAGQ
jgi:SAM-dependent methyltransferase